LPPPGFQTECGTRTSTWRRRRSTAALAPGFAAPLVASAASAVEPCTVTKVSAGDETPAPFGHGRGPVELPSANVNAVRSASFSVLSVTRKRVSPAPGRIRSSTRSAALCA
jgi:hypothetical protein